MTCKKDSRPLFFPFPSPSSSPSLSLFFPERGFVRMRIMIERPESTRRLARPCCWRLVRTLSICTALSVLLSVLFSEVAAIVDSRVPVYDDWVIVSNEMNAERAILVTTAYHRNLWRTATLHSKSHISNPADHEARTIRPVDDSFYTFPTWSHVNESDAKVFAEATEDIIVVDRGYGFPFQSMYYRVYAFFGDDSIRPCEYRIVNGLALQSDQNSWLMIPRGIPVAIDLPTFLINIVIWDAVVLIAFAGVESIHRMIRSRTPTCN